jgi:superfamily II DNA or RNA helicase/HKD family nuclease
MGESVTTPVCPFCLPTPESVFYESPLVLGFWDHFPVNRGHALLIPRRHVATWFDASRAEHNALLDGIEAAREIIDRTYNPAGYNIGVNVGHAGGQTVFHLHVHVIPRYDGDVADPTGGVRHVIASRANYLKSTSVTASRAPHERSLVCGDDDPLLPHLLYHLETAVELDVAVAFVLPGGARHLESHLRELLGRGGKLRLLTGDYLDVTDPDALRLLIDVASENSDRVELRAFETKKVGFHPKTYITRSGDGSGVAYVGSSNLTLSALTKGVEWNYRVVSSRDAEGFQDVVRAFDELFLHQAVVPLNDDWIDRYEARRRTQIVVPAEIVREEPEPQIYPHVVQQEALAALTQTRIEGNKAGLVVLATGLGKTWLSAFDSMRVDFDRILFVAHREEILSQAMKTYRRIRPGARLGFYAGQERDGSADVVFASVQTLSRANHLHEFRPDDFDYIVVDEFHHALAPTYRRLVEYFDPKFLLGLTATPERTDGGDLLALCGENLVYRCNLGEGISRLLLSPFHYYGVPDHVDYQNIPWRNNRFDPDELTNAVATESRAANALDQYRKRGGERTLAFCCSTRHADYMTRFFVDAGLRAEAVHSGTTSSPRAHSLAKLDAGELDIICAVDMFNEGVDVPRIDTVMMLRPTESRVLWLQQIGRGLRLAEGKDHLTIIDYIGNHRSFLLKPQALFGLGSADREIAEVLAKLRTNAYELPLGCHVTYELETIAILEDLLRPTRGAEAIQSYYEDFRSRTGQRPTATELVHEYYNPAVLRPRYGSWLEFVQSRGDLDERRSSALEEARSFLSLLEKTPMTRSYKMLVVTSMLNQDRFPGEVRLADLRDGVRALALRSGRIAEDLGIDLDDTHALDDLLIRNPIAAWTGGRGTGGEHYFEYTDGNLRAHIVVSPENRIAFQELAREIVEWRLAEYLLRAPAEEDTVVIKVNHANSSPILHPLDRSRNPGLPSGWTRVSVGGVTYELNFVKVAVNVARQVDGGPNVLPELLRRWFGPDAGMPGRNHRVQLRRDGDEYVLEAYKLPR